MLAALNHPNIAHIYGFEDRGSTHALVLELVEGPTLADRIAKGPLPLDEAPVLVSDGVIEFNARRLQPLQVPGTASGPGASR